MNLQTAEMLGKVAAARRKRGDEPGAERAQELQ